MHEANLHLGEILRCEKWNLEGENDASHNENDEKKTIEKTVTGSFREGIFDTIQQAEVL